MNTQAFDDGRRIDRRHQSKPVVAPQLTIAQSIRRSSDPHKAAVESNSRLDAPHDSNIRTYYFEDGSFLAFEVSYMAVEDGGR